MTLVLITSGFTEETISYNTGELIDFSSLGIILARKSAGQVDDSSPAVQAAKVAGATLRNHDFEFAQRRAAPTAREILAARGITPSRQMTDAQLVTLLAKITTAMTRLDVELLARDVTFTAPPLSVAPTPSPPPVSTPTIAFVNTSASVTEGDSGTKTVANVINATRNGVTGPLTVNLTYGGTATSGTDYVSGPVSGTIADGQSSLSFDLTINGDTGVESDETIVINAVVAGYSSATASKTITVSNDDVTVTPTSSGFTVFAGMLAGSDLGAFAGAAGSPRYGDRPLSGDGYTTQNLSTSGGRLLVGSDF